jgi:hypothetical protein
VRRLTTFMLLLGGCVLTSPASAAISISSGETYSEVSDQQGGYNYADLFNSSGAIATASLPGYISQTTTAYSTVGNSAIFSGAFNQSRQGNFGGYSYGALLVYFSPDTNLPYAAGGSYSNTNGFTYLYSYLYDYTTNTYPFVSDQESQFGPDSFTLGGAGGDYINTFTGSLTGTLTAGDSYLWIVNAYTQAVPTADLGAAASGSLSLTIGTIAAVPEFSSVIVWSLLALTIGGAGWWQRARVAA